MHERFLNLEVGKEYDFSHPVEVTPTTRVGGRRTELPRQPINRGILVHKGRMIYSFEGLIGGHYASYAFCPLRYPGLVLTEVDAGLETRVA